jgi:NAD+ diphosphatase
LETRAYFFQGDNLLLPVNLLDAQFNELLPLKLAEEFNYSDIFEIPAIDEEAPFMMNVVSVPPGTALPENWRAIPVRQLLAAFNIEAVQKILRACHIVQWRRDSCFCGTCGAKYNYIPAQAQCLCPKCGRMEFPRICPAIIVLITDSENRILLAHNKKFRKKVYSHISGFNEAGESLEQTVAREVREEVNIEVKNIQYIKSQSWPFPNSLMLGFKAQYESGTLQPDGEEIEDALWFTKENLPELPGHGSLSRILIDLWLADSL